MWVQQWFHAHDCLSFWHGSIIGKIKLPQGGLAERSPSIERPQGWWRHPGTTSSFQSTVKIPGEDGPVQLNIWKFRGQNSALRRPQGRLLLLLRKTSRRFYAPVSLFSSMGWKFLSLSFLGFSVSFTEDLGVPGCQKQPAQSCSALPSHQAVPSQHRAQHPRDYPFWHMATAKVHCPKWKLWPEFLF